MSDKRIPKFEIPPPLHFAIHTPLAAQQPPHHGQPPLSATPSSTLPEPLPYPVVHCKRWTSLLHGVGPGSFHRVLSLHRRRRPLCWGHSHDLLFHRNGTYPPMHPSTVTDLLQRHRQPSHPRCLHGAAREVVLHISSTF